jgi:signal transduction histidine kinase
MWNRGRNYFLEPFRQRSKAEVKKAYYLLWSCLTVLGFFVFLFISHSIFFSGGVYQVSDVLGMIGTVLAIYQFRRGNIENAGKVLIGVIIMVFTIQTVLTDMERTDPAIRYRLYVTLVCILGSFFLFISFFRQVRLLIYFGIIFIAILTLHYLIILHQIGNVPTMTMYATEHYIISCMSVVFATIISSLLITLIEKLYSQAIGQGEIIKRQNEELQQTVDEQTRFLVSSNESLKEFAYLTSHDLREPLRNISGFISLIKKHSDNKTMEAHAEEINEYFRYVQKGVGQMEELIGDIKVYSGINVLEKNFSAVAMGDLVYQVKDALEAEITQANATINIQAGMPVVHADKTLLFSLIQNLIANAIKYRKPGVEPIVDIRHSQSPDSNVHTFSIHDNGIGIDKDYYDRIFYAFKRLHGKDGDYEGTGLGLAICKKIVEIHGGRIWVDSTPGEGSTFFFTLH